MPGSLVVARKELVDHLRDSRALASTGVYALMGPVVTWVIVASFSADDGGARLAAVTPIIASVFTLMSAFSGGNSVSIDMIAGERERRSLLPLLMNSVSRTEIVVGKWLSASVFAACSALVTLLAFVIVFAVTPGMPSIALRAVYLIPSLLLLAPFATALQVLVSAWCRNAKEANTYLTILIFLVIGLSMWLAFSPEAAQKWWFLLPVAGHQHVLRAALASNEFLPVGSAALAGVSLTLAAAAIALTGRLFRRDAIVYGD